MQRCSSKNGGEGCDQPVVAKGMCQAHYRAEWRRLKGVGKKSGDDAIRQENQVILHRTRVSAEVAYAVQEHAHLLGISAYEMERRIFHWWHKHRQQALPEITAEPLSQTGT